MQSSNTNPEYEFQIEDNPGSGRKRYLYKVLKIKAVQRCYVILEEMFELHCTFLCFECYAVQHVTKSGWTFIYFSSFFPWSSQLRVCWHKKQVSFIFWQENVAIKMFLNKSIHFPVAYFIQFCTLRLLLEAGITGSCFVLEQPCVLSKGSFCILLQCLWHHHLSLGVPVAFNNGISIDRQYLYQCLDNLCQVTYLGKLFWGCTQPGLYWHVWKKNTIIVHTKRWYDTYFLKSDGRLKSSISSWFFLSKLQSQNCVMQLLSVLLTLTGNLMLFQVVNIFCKFFKIHT